MTGSHEHLRARSHAMVVAPQPEAVESGAHILSSGGNAVDAAIACALTQTVVDPLMCGIAGFGSLAAYLPTEDFHGYYDFHSPAPGAAHPDMWEDLIVDQTRDGFGFILEDHVNELGYQSIGVPAALRAFYDVHHSHGRIPWAEVVAPAIEWADGGWTVRPAVERFWSDPGEFGHVPNSRRISYTEAAKNLYCRDDGTPKRIGDIVCNRAYAEVLRSIARHGPDVFYHGEIAYAMVDDLRAHGSLVTMDDLRTYRVKQSPPIWTTYRQSRVSVNRPPGGGVMLAEMLNILESFELRKLEHNSSEYIRIVSETMKAATADKDRWVGDPEFVDVPLDLLISKSHAHQVAARIEAGEKINVPRYAASTEGRDTTHISVVDDQGNAVSMTHSLGLPSGVITDGLGFMYNGCMSGFDPRSGRANSIQPGKARFSSICPTIIVEDGNPSLVIGAPGGPQIAMGVLQVLLNVVEFGFDMQNAVSQPRFSATSDVIDVVNRIPRSVTSELEVQGYEVARTPWSHAFGLVHGILVRGAEIQGGADPRGDGMAIRV